MCPTPCMCPLSVSRSMRVPLHVCPLVHPISCVSRSLCGAHSVSILLCVHPTRCVPLRVCPAHVSLTPCVSPYVHSHCSCVPFRVSYSGCVPHRMGPIPRVPFRASHFVFHFVRVPSHIYPTLCDSHSRCVPLPVSSTPCVFHSLCLPLPVSSTPCIFHSLCLPLPVSSTPCVFHSLCLPLPVSPTPDTCPASYFIRYVCPAPDPTSCASPIDIGKTKSEQMPVSLSTVSYPHLPSLLLLAKLEVVVVAGRCIGWSLCIGRCGSVAFCRLLGSVAVLVSCCIRCGLVALVWSLSAGYCGLTVWLIALWLAVWPCSGAVCPSLWVGRCIGRSFCVWHCSWSLWVVESVAFALGKQINTAKY